MRNYNIEIISIRKYGVINEKMVFTFYNNVTFRKYICSKLLRYLLYRC